MSNPEFLKVENLTAKIGTFLLHDISFSVPEKSCVAILGESGSGKTQLLRVISGFLKNINGKIYLDSLRIDNLPVRKREIGFVSQESLLYPHLNIKENLKFPLFFSKKKKEKEKTIREFSTLNEFNQILDLKVERLDESYKTLVFLIKEKLKNSKLLLIDGIFSKIDHHQNNNVFRIILNFLKGKSFTILITVNSLKEVFSIADYVLILSNGSVIQYGTLKEVYDSPCSYIALCAMSLFFVNKIKVRVRNNKIIPFGFSCNQKDGEYDFCFRSEEIEISNYGIKAKLLDKTFITGEKEHYHCLVNVEDKQFKVDLLTSGVIDRSEFYFLPVRYYLFKGDE